MAAQDGLLTLFKQALMSPTGAIRMPFGDVEEAIRLRRKLYKSREKVRDEERRKQPRRSLGPVLTYDACGKPIGVTDVFLPKVPEMSTPYDCLQFRIVDGDLVIRRAPERVLDEASANAPPLPEAYDMASSEVKALPKWPFSSRSWNGLSFPTTRRGNSKKSR
jgi:hypothetical protein